MKEMGGNIYQRDLDQHDNQSRRAARRAREVFDTANAAMEETSRKFEAAEGALIEAMATEEGAKKNDC
jgi:hypothetical protein